MALHRRVIQWIDLDVAQWRGAPVLTMLVSLSPMILWSLLTHERPADAPPLLFGCMMLPPTVFGAIGVWRGWQHLWAEHKRIQQLGAAEAAAAQRERES